MFNFLKKLFSSPDNTQLLGAIREGALLVDVRSPMEFASGSVKGAVNIPLSDIENRLSQLRGYPSIVVFCLSGHRSARAKRILAQNGFSNTINGGTWRNVRQYLEKDT